MNSVTVRFYAELNELLPRAWRHYAFRCAVNGRVSVKDLIESLGIPHTEVNLILIDGESASFEQHLNGGEYISVYPPFRAMEIGSASKVSPEPLPEIRFVLDAHLGKLTAYLRMLGFDCFYSNSADDDELTSVSAGQRRILLTCDRGLLKRSRIIHGYLVRTRYPEKQLIEIIQRYDLVDHFQPFSRCIHCNTALLPISKDKIVDRLPEKVIDFCDEFTICQTCDHVYWKGTHYENMLDFIQRIKSEAQKKTSQVCPSIR